MEVVGVWGAMALWRGADLANTPAATPPPGVAQRAPGDPGRFLPLIPGFQAGCFRRPGPGVGSVFETACRLQFKL